ncbi:MAG: 4-(cytidine 5'-diphospho)-2-C-methyl-D-erythritol kinase [Clostridia bacterium]|nr:4-(cytidine 5'-diphospho)-2-C-methyl-D-erythritol kinase [Clostridia bacterium]
MKQSISLRAPGKINLFLDAVGLLPDGYHEIVSVMHAVDLCDRLRLSLAPSARRTVKIVTNRAGVPTDERNIAYRAARAFWEATGQSGALKICLSKSIPLSGGMAGGSTDGAAVLRGLNALYGCPLSGARLLELAAALGADVPFCLVGSSALCTGTGADLSPLESRTRLRLLIVPSAVGVSTPWAYGELDRLLGDLSARREENKERLARLATALSGGDILGVCGSMYNIFEEVVLPARPLAARAKEILLAFGADGAMLSGSGPTVFGIFSDAAAQKSAAAALRAAGYRPIAAQSK